MASRLIAVKDEDQDSMQSTGIGATYTSVYQIDARAAGAIAIRDLLKASGIPDPFAEHPEDPMSFVAERHARRVKDSAGVWEVVVTWRPPNVTMLPQAGATQPEPRDRPPDDDCHTYLIEIAAEKDLDGYEVVNSAGDRFSNPVMQQIPVLVRTVSRYEVQDPFPLKIGAYAHTLNEDNWCGFPPDTVWLQSVKRRVVYEYVNPIYYVTYEFHILCHPELTWIRGVLDAGYYCLEDDGEGNMIRVPCKDGKGVVSTIPLMLDVEGTQATSQESSPLMFRFINRANFNALAI